MSSATVEARARKKAERKLEKQRQAAQHDLPRSMRPSAAVKTFTVVLLVLVLIYFLFPIYWAIIASTKTPAQMTGSNGMWFAVPLDQLPNAIATNYSKLLGWTRGNFWRWVLNSLIYSGVSALIGTIVSVMAGYATAKFNFRGKNAAIGIIMACMLMPSALLTIPHVLDLPHVAPDQHDALDHHPVLRFAVRLLPGPHVRTEFGAGRTA